MQIRFHCPSCDLPMRISRWETLEHFACPKCGEEIPIHLDPTAQEKLQLRQCPICESPDLFRQKAFNRNVGIGIVAAGIIVSFFVSLPIIPLLAVGLIDAVLYLWLKDMMVCYRCDAEFRGFKADASLEHYDHLKAAEAKKQPTYPGAREAAHNRTK